MCLEHDRMEELSVEMGTATGSVKRREDSAQRHAPQLPDLAQAVSRSQGQT